MSYDAFVDDGAVCVATEPQPDRPILSVVGLGYVGAVTSACLADLGFQIIGCDVSPAKVASIHEGKALIVEAGLQERLQRGVRTGRIKGTNDVKAAVVGSSVTLLSVGTPSGTDGAPCLEQIRSAAESIGSALRNKSTFHTIILRCTVPPGTTRTVVIPALARSSGKRPGIDFGVCFVPEFLREGTAVADFYDPPKTVIAPTDERAFTVARDIFQIVSRTPSLRSTIEAAEMLKYVDNVWHATKVVFGNEVGRLCKKIGVDSHEVMTNFCSDTKLNISPYYLKPGFAYGGSCLPKEVRAFMDMARQFKVCLPLVESLSRSNNEQIELAVKLAAPFQGRRLGLLGITFKIGTDDIRESPYLELGVRLLRAGHKLRVYDPNVLCSPSVRDILLADKLPEVRLLSQTIASSAAELVAESDTVIVSHNTEEYRLAVGDMRSDTNMIDLARLFNMPQNNERYEGIAW